MNDGLPQEDTLRALFADRLANEPLPADTLERLTARVLAEVRSEAARREATARGDASLAAGQGPGGSLRGIIAAWFAYTRARLRSLTPKQSLLLAGAGALGALLVFVAISRVTPRPLSITAEVSGGAATVLSWHSDKFRVQGDGDLLKLRQGDQILTRDGAVRLSHLPEQLVIVEPGTHVELTRVDEANDGRQLELTVHDGVVHSQITKPLQAQDLYVITTPGVTVTAVGTNFTVETVSEEETLVTTTAGQVRVAMGSQVVTVGPGQEVDAVAGRSLVVQPADGQYDGGLAPVLIAAPAGGLQLYALPRGDAAPVGRLPAGHSATIQARVADGNWVQVCCVAGKAAWVQIDR